jgi:hypothetical protein
MPDLPLSGATQFFMKFRGPKAHPNRPDLLFLVEPTTALLADPVFREHLTGREHPERPERFDAVVRGLRQTAEATLAALVTAGRGA